MIFENLNLVKCPLCKNNTKWDYNGEFTEGSVKRLTNGEIVCDENHTWTICEEILRIDNQKSNENMIYYDTLKTGFPKEVTEIERTNFINQFRNFTNNLELENNRNYQIYGDTILFLKYVNINAESIVIVNKDEKVLRQLQEIAVNKRIYDKCSFLRSDYDDLIIEGININLFLPKLRQGHNFIFSDDEKGEIIWQGKNKNLVWIQS